MNENQNKNLMGWVNIFFRLPYESRIRIYDQEKVNILDFDEQGQIYDGLLKNLSYLELQELCDFEMNHVEARNNTIILLGYQN